MSNRRDFLKTAAFAALGSGMAINHVFAGGNDAPSLFNVNSRAGVTPKMKLRFFPYELKLRHVFTVATYSRTTTPDVQVEIEYDGIIGYGEASMPPYLQHELGTMDSVLAFLKKVQDVIGQFSDPFQLEDILAYIDSLSAGDSAAKTAVDIAWVTQQSPLPIFADESIQRLKDVAGLKGAFTGINIKLMKCTGMREAWKMVTLARALDMKVMVGCMTETSCAITAASQFSPAVDFADLDGSLLIANDRSKGMEVVKGKITLPDLPGIGVVKL